MALFDVSDLTEQKEPTENKFEPPKKREKKEYTAKVPRNPEDWVRIYNSFSDTKFSDFFTEDKFKKNLVFYDFEVFKYDWLVVLIEPVAGKRTIIANEPAKLRAFQRSHEDSIFIGYNNLHYDTYIFKGICLGADPYKVSDCIINKGLGSYQIEKHFGIKFSTIPMLSYDVMCHIANAPSLKVLEAYMGNDIEETDVPFDIPRALERKEMHLTQKYCSHDVEQTIEVFKRRIDDWNAVMTLMETFDLDDKCISFTKPQLTAQVLECERKDHDDEFDITIVDTLRLQKYDFVRQWFLEVAKKKDYKLKMETDVCGIPHQFGWGGLHGAPVEPVHSKGRIWHVDVTSYYPSIMMRYDMLTRNCRDPQKYKTIFDMRVALKKAGKKKEQAPYKICLNSTYGILKDKYSLAWDPVMGNNVCVNGQLMLLDLLEHLEKHCEILQSNTDGLIIECPDERSERIMKHICQEWIERTGMQLEFEKITSIYQKDVNNYVVVFEDDIVQSKLNKLQNELMEMGFSSKLIGNTIHLN